MIRRFFGAAIFLAGTVNSLAAMAQPAERPAMIRLVAAAETVSDSRCTGAVFVINDSSEAACAMSVLGESGGLAGFRLPAGLARGLGDALAQSQRPRPEALAQRAGGPALPAAATPVSAGGGAGMPAGPQAAAAAARPNLEPDTDRQGADYRTDELSSGGAQACRALCLAEPNCRAFSFVRAAQGRGAGACWLKDDVPAAAAARGIVSGVVRPRAEAASAAPIRAASAAPPATAARHQAGGPPASDAPAAPAPNMRPGWAEMQQRVERGPEGDLVVRYGDIDNLGHGWADGFDPFSGAATEPHAFPFAPGPNDPPGTDRILVGTGVTLPNDRGGDGYHTHAERPAATPPEMRIPIAPLPPEIRQVLVQFFVDDFQAPSFQSRFQVTLNGQRLPGFETVFNALDQTGPVGKLVSLRLLPEFFPLLAGGEAVFRIDDPDSGGNDGFAIDFVRVMVNPRIMHPVTILARVLEHDSDRPIAGAWVEAGLSAGRSDPRGLVRLEGVPAGLVAVTGNREGYDGATEMQDAAAGETVEVTLRLARRQETASALRQEVERRGRATIRGIHFDFDRDTPRADSLPALEALKALIDEMDDKAWIIEGHTDGVGGAAHNRRLSQARAQAVIAWLAARGVDPSRLTSRGLGPDQPMADNTTEDGRALNRRVEAVPQR